jgi:hypothetical protein
MIIYYIKILSHTLKMFDLHFINILCGYIKDMVDGKTIKLEEGYINKTKIKSIPDWKGTKIHPLPLLTCEGNGRGGGDFRGEHDLIGSWARDVISVEAVKPLNYKEVVFDLVEG